MSSMLKQRVAGLFISVIGFGFTYWMWLTAIEDGTYRVFPSMVFPGFAIVGLGVMLFPFNTQELKEKYGVEKPQNIKQWPPVWWVIVPVAIIAGLANRYVLDSGMVLSLMGGG